MTPRNQNSDDDGPHDEISALLRAAASDAPLRKQIVALARLPSFQHESVIKSALHEMTLRREPPEIRAAFGLLATDLGAAIALRLLSPDETLP